MFKFIRFHFLLFVFLGATQARQMDQTSLNYTVIPLEIKSWSPTIIVTIQNLKIPLQFDRYKPGYVLLPPIS